MIDFRKLRDRIQWLRGEDGVVSTSESARVLAEILEPLFFSDGFALEEKTEESGIDWVARRAATADSAATTVAVQYKHNAPKGGPLGRSAARSALSTIVAEKLDRLLLISRHGFSPDAVELAVSGSPVELQLFTLLDLTSWVDRAEIGVSESGEAVRIKVRALAHELALLVARHPLALFEVEWRELEQLVARILEGLGFVATLTPPSKDGGKDIIAECTVADGPRSYIVELKHWRSGKRVGAGSVTEFVEVVAAEKRDGGLFMSTSGYTDTAFSTLKEVERRRFRFGGRNKIVALAQTYDRAAAGLWSPPAALPEVLFEFTE